MSAPEVRTHAYRRVLALLPRTYREQRGEEMLAVMLDAAADEGRSGPSFGEGLSVLGLSVRLRAGAPGASPRARSVGDMLRLITLIGLLLQAAVFTIAPVELLQMWIGPASGPGFGAMTGFDVWHLAGELSGLVCPFFALAALLHGRRRLGLALTTNALVLVAAFQLTPSDAFRYPAGSDQTYYTLALCAVPTVSGLLGFHRDAPPVPRPRAWLAAAFVVAVPLVALDLTPGTFGLDVSNLFIIACGCAAVGVALRRAARSAAWPAALMIAGAPTLFPLSAAMRTVPFFEGPTTVISRLVFSTNPVLWVSLYAPVIEVALALTLAASLVWRLRKGARRLADSG